MKDLRARRGYNLMQRLVAAGEHVHQDFKYVINDARKIARSISAFANNDGGSLLIGVKDNGVIAGVRNEEDIYVVEQAAQLYCRPAQQVEFDAVKCAGGLVVIRASVLPSPSRPVCVDEGNGRLRAYFRVADENILAHSLMVRAWRMAGDDNADFSLTLSSDETSVLQAINSGNSIEPNQVCARVLMSQRRVNDIICRLVSIGLVDFAYLDKKWKLVSV